MNVVHELVAHTSLSLEECVRRTLKWILLLVVLSVVPSLATLGQGESLPFQHSACANGVDLTGQTVTLYHVINPLDQVETVYNPIHAGYSDAAEYFNAHGGICGATLVQGLDNPSQLPTDLLYKQYAALNPKPVLVTIYGSGDGEAMMDQLAQDKIPALNVRAGSSASAYGQDGQTLGWEFATNPLYVDQLGAMCDYIAANPDRFPKPVIGFMNNGDSWATVSAEQGRGYCESKGVGYAGASTFDNDLTFLQPQIQKLIDAGANIIYTTSDENGPALVAKTLADMGLKGKVPLAAVNRAMDPYAAFSGEKDLDANGVPVISGMIGALPIHTFAEQDHPGIQLITEQADLHQRPLTLRTDEYIMGWDTTDLFIEVYIQTGNRVGFDHITGADIKETLENIVYAPLSGVERIDYHGGMRRALSENRIGEMDYLGQDGKTAASASNPPMVVKEGDQQHLVPMIVPLTDYLTAPDLRPTGANVPPPEIVQAAEDVHHVGQIVFEGKPKNGRDADGEIYFMNADRSHFAQLTHDHSFDGQPVWSPEGSKIVFVSARDGNSEIYVMNADGTNPINLSNNPAFEELPNWSPDGKQIVFNSQRDGNNDIYVMNADGTDQTNLTNNPAFDDFPNWSPDGKQIAMKFTS